MRSNKNTGLYFASNLWDYNLIHIWFSDTAFASTPITFSSLFPNLNLFFLQLDLKI